MTEDDAGLLRHRFEESSNIASIGYHPKLKRLFVEFKSGGVYAYEDVAETVFHEFKGAKSAGGHFHGHVRGKYKERKL
jgi:hypothetical protein